VGKNGDRGYRVLVEALQKTQRVAIGTFTWRGKTTPIAIRVHQDGLLLQRLYFADEVQNAAEIDKGAEPKIRDQERTLAERLISELSGTEFQPEHYEDEYRKRVLKAIEQKIAGQEIERVEAEDRPPTTDLVATLKASLGRKALAKTVPTKAEQELTPAKRPARRRRAS
jgi:DNA end-binding protein Ku